MTNDPYSQKKYGLASNIKVKYQGSCDLLNYYKYIKYWLEDNDFISDEKTFETRYSERTNAKGRKTTEVVWECLRNSGSMYQYSLRIGFFIMGAQEIEVQENDAKVTLTKATYEMRITGALITDPDNKLKDYGQLKRIYFHYLIRKDLNYHKAYFYGKIYEVQEEMKKFLQTHSF
jgi:hypothetical protein